MCARPAQSLGRPFWAQSVSLPSAHRRPYARDRAMSNQVDCELTEMRAARCCLVCPPYAGSVPIRWPSPASGSLRPIACSLVAATEPCGSPTMTAYANGHLAHCRRHLRPQWQINLRSGWWGTAARHELFCARRMRRCGGHSWIDSWPIGELYVVTGEVHWPIHIHRSFPDRATDAGDRQEVVVVGSSGADPRGARTAA
jgi:hypothetical protein